jgi:hypothetical protein
MCRVSVEIDIHAGLPETMELEWRGVLRTHKLDFLGVPFRFTRCRQTGHLRRDCHSGNLEESSFESSMLWRPTSSNPLELSSGGWNVRFPRAKPPEEDKTAIIFSGKLRKICPSLYFSLSSWERYLLDLSFGRGSFPAWTEDPSKSLEMDSLLDLFMCLNQGFLGGKPPRSSEKCSIFDLFPSLSGVSCLPVDDSLESLEEESSRPERVLGTGGSVTAPGSPDLDLCVGQATVDLVEHLHSETEVALYSSV